MRTLIVAGLALLAGAGGMLAADTAVFDRYFIDRTLRIDYFHTGQAKEEIAAVDRLYQQGVWAGSRVHLLDTLDLGRYRASAYDAASGALIFSRGFDSYFGEYRTTAEAAKGCWKTYHETVLLPFPKQKIRFTLEARQEGRPAMTILQTEIDPADYTISREPLSPGVTVIPVLAVGDPHARVDVAILGEGYTLAEEAKFRADLDRFAGVMFSQEPYASLRDRFNLYGVLKPSAESGCDEPSRGVYRNTALGATFDSLGSERYLLTEEIRALRDVAAHVPYDALYIMVNQPRYGGGGIYNFYCTFTSDNQWQAYLFLHEFGHSFAGLADEYYTSSTAYSEFYPPGIEPREANITALQDSGALKWKDQVTAGTAVPTPWEKAAYDAQDIAYQKVRQEINDKIARLMREGAPASEVDALKAEAERLSKENADSLDAFLKKSRFVGQVGAFEGAGYASTGLYRPMLDCIMFSKGHKPFCKVCQQAIRRVIAFHGE